MTDTAKYKKPVPLPDEASRPFFDGAKEHRLMLQRCATCGTWHWPVISRCPTCLSTEVTWAQASGKGTLYTFALMHQVLHPAFASAIPYNVAEIDLEEGVRVTSTIVGCSNNELHIGMPLRVTFEDISNEVSLPKFQPSAE